MILAAPAIPHFARPTIPLQLTPGECGSSEKPTSTADWADGVCSAITTWTNSIKSAGDSLKGGGISKDSLQSAADDVTSATKTLESDLKDLGKPDTKAGQQAKDLIDQLSSDVTTDVDSIKTAVDDASGISGIASVVELVSTTFGTMKSQISSTLKSLEQLDATGELKTAFQQSSTCQQLRALASRSRSANEPTLCGARLPALGSR